jgi:RNA polymerase sigma-70 factor (sigma-E family)
MTTARNQTGSIREDELLARVYQQVIGAQAERYAAAYDASAGLARFTGWLTDHTAANLERAADQAVAQLYALHYQSLTRLAALLVRDVATADEVVQDAFAAMHDAWHRFGDPEEALAYLRQAVVNRSRSVLRHRIIADTNRSWAPPDMPSAERGALVLLESEAALAALRGLPVRQREAILLRYYADLSEDQIAAVMGISRGAVKNHTARGMAALRAAVEQATPQPDPPEDSEPGPDRS